MPSGFFMNGRPRAMTAVPSESPEKSFRDFALRILENGMSPRDIAPVLLAVLSQHSQVPISNKNSEPPGKHHSLMARQPKISPYFPNKPRSGASCLPFPPISATSFGLIQEKLAHDPFRLLIATIFLNRTRGEVAIPVLYNVFERYPTVSALAEAREEDVVTMIRCLGLQNARARKCINLAKLWIENPPAKGKRYRKLHYPNKGDGLDIKPGECVDDGDSRVAWEIAHIPGLGSYALDSWRIFCRDELRGLAIDWKGTEASGEFVPEWKSVVPKDKELRAYVSWMWLKEGWEWEKETGNRRRASRKLRLAALKGGIIVETYGRWLLETPTVEKSAYFEKTVQGN
ncbi:hypothetical protein ACO22_05546 [Paracoccidioides brasiliensis]|uniref:HhH-GPD domain-containing protein n=1 Tax=Paracoccidioides brasiliensis TaxID=121759 RepID=A0A1D2JA45_PARBR|nr:hypothetical protein ACO22_05546 [Paracoccidioides brasiliensis]